MSNYKPITSLSDLWQRAKGGDEVAQQLCINTLTNLGAEHLATQRKRDTKWEAHYTGLMAYLMSSVSEYGVDEDTAFANIIEEVNHLGETNAEP